MHFYQVQGGAPSSESLSWCLYNSNFTIGDVSIVSGVYKPIYNKGGTTLQGVFNSEIQKCWRSVYIHTILYIYKYVHTHILLKNVDHVVQKGMIYIDWNDYIESLKKTSSFYFEHESVCLAAELQCEITLATSRWQLNNIILMATFW